MTTTSDDATTFPTLGAGLPVALGEIDREIKTLWEQSGSVASRASLMNLAVYCEGQESVAANNALIGRITVNHACRAILICAEPGQESGEVRAWISAHCHVSRAGAKQVCCEQITFLLPGKEQHRLIPSIVFSHLDSDLPLYLWWQGEFPQPMDRQLWTWVDRLIYDSSQWRDQCSQLRLLRDSLSEAQGRITLCDLNWARSLYLRQAVSTVFDHPESLALLPQLERVSLDYAPGYHFAALLVIGWFASRLGWQCRSKERERLVFTSARKEEITVTLHEKEGPLLSRLSLEMPGAKLRFYREESSPFLHVEAALADGRQPQTLMPADEEELSALVDEELSRGSRHKIYLQALAAAESFL